MPNKKRKRSLGLVPASNIYMLDGKTKKKIVNPMIWIDIDSINGREYLHMGVGGEFIEEFMRKEMEPHLDIYIPRLAITRMIEILERALKPTTPREEFNLADFMRKRDEEVDELSDKD